MTNQPNAAEKQEQVSDTVDAPVRCVCTGQVRADLAGTWERCPLEGGGHTTFMLLTCLACGHMRGFPDDNLTLALEKGTGVTKMTLAELMNRASNTNLSRGG